MKKLDLTEVAERMELEGFDYCFRNYSDWDEIKDEEFHKLREAYIAAADMLEFYVTDNSEYERGV